MSQPTVKLGQAIDQILTALEGFDKKARETIIGTVCSHLELAAGHTRRSDTPPPPPADSSREHTHDEASKHRRNIDIRSLKEQKQPKSAGQMACIVAYYLNEYAHAPEKKATVKTDDLEKYFKQAGYKLPQKLNQVLVDAKAAESPRLSWRLFGLSGNDFT